MANIFNTIEVPASARTLSKYDWTPRYVGDFKVGPLYPILCETTLPNDRWRISTSHLLRSYALQAPIFSEMDVYVHYFYVPYRILWNNFKKYYTGQQGYRDTARWPKIVFGANPQTSSVGCLADYFGLPVGQTAQKAIDSLPFRAYQMIYNEFYRDQNLIPEVKISLGDRFDVDEEGEALDPQTAFSDLTQLRYRAYAKDLFTSALPFAQKGDPIYIPQTVGDLTFIRSGFPTFVDINGRAVQGDVNLSKLSVNQLGQVVYADGTQQPTGEVKGYLDVSKSLKVVNDQAAYSIEDLRFSIALQQFLELDARAGTRYPEYLLAHFNVECSDKSLSRPQYLGGGRAPVQISSVIQQSETTDTSALGDYAGLGISTDSCDCEFFAEEYGIIMAIMSIRPKPYYFQGLRRMWTRFDRYEFGLPEFAHLGEEPIENQEIYLTAIEDQNTDIFGYGPRYYDFKYIPNTIVGNVRSTLKYFTTARKFDNLPTLNQNFIEVSPTDVKDIFPLDTETVEGAYQFIGQFTHTIECLRVLPKYAYPNII